MNVGYSMVRANPERGYGGHFRSWIILPVTKSPELAAPTSGINPHFDHLASAGDSEMTSVEPSSSESINQAPDRRILTGKPSDVLLNLLNVTKKIFAYLPVNALHSCLDVCETFRRLGHQELETRSRAFIMARKTANAANAMDLLGQLFTRQYDHFLCEPRLIIALKTKTLHRKSSRRGGEVFMRIAASLSPTPGARACFPRDSVNHEMIVGDNIFYLYPGGSVRFCTFSALQIPIIPGLVIRHFKEDNNCDHALRIGHFRCMQHCFDDISPAEMPLIGRPGFLLLTDCSTLGVPGDTQVLDFPFCALAEQVKQEHDGFAWCGPRTRVATVWLDHRVHCGQVAAIRSEFDKIHPTALLADAGDVFGLYFTTAPPLLNHTEPELAVWRECFPRARLTGCTLRDTLFGNTASTVCETSVADRTVKVCHATGHASASIFFLVVVTK